MSQGLSALLRALNLKNDAGTVKAVQKQLDEMGSGNPFPYTGDALIDGTLNIDFTGTMDFLMDRDATVNFGKVYISGPGWIPASADGPLIANRFEDDDVLILSAVFDGLFDSGFGFIPVQFGGQLMEVKSGDYQGSVLSNTVEKIPDGSLLAGVSINIKKGDDNRRYFVQTIINSEGNDGLLIQKINEAGEVIQIFISDKITGFRLENTLTDDTASVFRIENNNSQSIIDMLNDNLQSDVVLSHDYADDAAAEIGGVPVGGFYHTSGALKIRTT